MQRFIYFTIQNGEEQKLDAKDAYSPTSNEARQLVAEHLGVEPLLIDGEWNSAERPSLNEFLAAALGDHGVQITRIA